MVLRKGATFVSNGYYLILPVGGYATWQGARLEGKGVRPDLEVSLSYDGIRQGRDNQLETAIECLQRGVASLV